jgi:hypothetical protein
MPGALIRPARSSGTLAPSWSCVDQVIAGSFRPIGHEDGFEACRPRARRHPRSQDGHRRRLPPSARRTGTPLRTGRPVVLLPRCSGGRDGRGARGGLPGQRRRSGRDAQAALGGATAVEVGEPDRRGRAAGGHPDEPADSRRYSGRDAGRRRLRRRGPRAAPGCQTIVTRFVLAPERPHGTE